MLDYREPPNGDFVAFVEKIEREQLARAMQPHKLPSLSAGGKITPRDATDSQSQPQSAREAQRVLQSLREQASTSTPGARAALIGAAIGAALIAFGLMAEGGIFLALVGALLLWHNLRKLWRSAAFASAGAAAAQQVNHAFDQQPQKTTRTRNG